MKKFQSLLFNVLMALAISVLFFSPASGGEMIVQTGLIVAGSQIALHYIPISFSSMLTMAVQKEIWEKDIVDNLFKNNDFAARAFNADQYVLQGKVVHIPRAGAPTGSQKNVTAFPITAVKRTDDDITYPLDTYYQAPKFVEKVEQYELSYDKRQSIMGEQQSQLIDDSMDGLIYRWAWKGASIYSQPGNYVLTTGGSASTATTTDLIPGASGSRLIFTKDTVMLVKKSMDLAKIPTTGRVALLTVTHYNQFLESLSDVERTNFYRVADMSKGIIGTYLGFDFIMRSTVQRWRKVAGVWTPIDEQDPGFAASVQTGDSYASLFYHENSVERARGQVNVFEESGRTEYYGDLFSMNMRLGGRQRREAGVYSVIEDIV